MASASLAGHNYARYPRSILNQLSTAKSTLTAAPYITGRDKRLVFVSEWVFKPEGIKAVKTRFQDALKKNDLIANHEWDGKDNVFRVRCIVGDTPKVSAIFSGILCDIVTESHGDDYLSDEDEDVEIMVSNANGEEEPFQSDKIERVSAWKKRHDIAEPTTQPQNMVTAIELRRQETAPLKSLGEEGLDEPRYAWTPKDTRLHLDDDITSDATLKILGDLTGCHFTKDLKQRKLFISHSSPEACQLAIKKLHNLKKYSEPMIPYVNHVFYTEGIQNFQLSFYPFVDMKKRFFKTTILHPYRIGPELNYYKLFRAYTVRCALWNGLDGHYMPIPIGILVPVTKDTDISSKSKELMDFKYCEKGSLETHPLRHVAGDEERQVSCPQKQPRTLARGVLGELQQAKQIRIEGWAQQLPQETLTNGPGTMTGGSLVSGLNIPELNISTIGVAHNDSTSRFTLNYSRTSSSVAPSLLDEDMPRMDIAPLQPQKSSSALWSLEQLPATALSSVSNVHLITTAQDLNSRALDSPLMQNRPTESPQEIFQICGKFNIAKDQTVIKPSQKAYEAESPRMRLGQSSAPLGALPNQGKNLKQAPAPDPCPEFISRTNSSVNSLMTGLQGFPGEIVVQAELGKIILRKINRKFVSLDNKSESFPPNELLTQLLPNPKKKGIPGQALFTNILTTLSTDVGYLLDMKNQGGKPMWEKQGAESSIIYEVSCHAERLSGWSPFSIEIDGEDFNTRVKTRYDFGAVNVHGTLRHWDFRIVAFGFGDDEENDRLYGDFARAIQRSLYIPPKLSKPCLYFELDESFIEKSKLAIDSILVHHTTKYKSTDKDASSILSISEIRALDVDSRYPFQGAPFQIYKAEWPQAHQNGIENLNVWHEVNISSAKANEQLKQNITLGLGDEAEWTPESLQQLDAASAMYLPACEMLKQMDGVGLYNDNGIELREPSTDEKSPPKPYFFW